MTGFDFFKEKIVYIVCQLAVLILTASILWMLSPSGGPELSVLIGTLYIIGAAVPIIVEYNHKKSFYKNLLFVFDSLDKKNLIAEIITPPSFKEGVILYDILKGCNKAMIEAINRYKFLQVEYREYMELWVHEIKTPIASSRLIAQNNKNEATDSIAEELDKIEGFVEQVLFYSRSNSVEKDYIIKEINLQKLCFDFLKKNSKLFIQNNIGIEADNLDVTVFTDAKWLEFILNQILTNSIKYTKGPGALVKLNALKSENSVILSVEDNGIGIPWDELPRIFDKGFTGTNGRKYGKSTGMGLYICKKLCDKLGLLISASSRPGEGAAINIAFPKSSMVDIR